MEHELFTIIDELVGIQTDTTGRTYKSLSKVIDRLARLKNKARGVYVILQYQSDANLFGVLVGVYFNKTDAYNKCKEYNKEYGQNALFDDDGVFLRIGDLTLSYHYYKVKHMELI